MTALATSPLRTLAPGIASLIDTTMTSPIEAYFRFEPPSTLMHMTFLAPELSATSRTVVIWTMAVSLRLLGSLDHSLDAPAFLARQRTGLNDLHAIASTCLVS